MSKIKVNYIVNKTEDGPVEFTKGAIIPAGQQFDVSGNVSVAGIATVSQLTTNDMNVGGTITANNFVGDGSSLGNLPTMTHGRMLAYKRILGYDEYRA